MSKTILFADDDSDDHSFVEYAIRAIHPEFTVLEAKDGRQTIELLNKLQNNQLPNLIILDFNMPQMDGLQTLQLIKADSRYNDIPVIMYSNGSFSGYIKSCLSEGAQAFFTKGASLSEIKEEVHTMLSYCK